MTAHATQGAAASGRTFDHPDGPVNSAGAWTSAGYGGNEAIPAELVAPDLPPPTGWPTLRATLAEICLCLTEALPAAESAGVVVFPARSPLPGQRQTWDGIEVIGAPPVATDFIQLEKQLDEGPVLTACQSQSVVTSGDLGADQRWRQFGRAVADFQVHSVASVPLPGHNSITAGVLNVYSHERDAFDARAINLIGAIAGMTTHALFAADLLDRAQRAFDAMHEAWDRSRIVNQAIGVLIGAHSTEEQARARLARMASRGNDNLAAAAAIIVEEASREAHLNFIALPHPR